MGDKARMRCERFTPTLPIISPMVYTGKWKLTKAIENGMEVTFPDDANITITFRETEDPSAYSFNTKVVNRFRTTVYIKEQSGVKFDSIDVGIVRSSKKMPSEELKEIELFFGKVLEDMKRMKSYVNGNKKLMMRNRSSELHADWIESGDDKGDANDANDSGDVATGDNATTIDDEADAVDNVAKVVNDDDYYNYVGDDTVRRLNEWS